MVNSPEEYYLRPAMLAERFPNERSMAVSPAIGARIKAQNKAGHLVFGSVEE